MLKFKTSKSGNDLNILLNLKTHSQLSGLSDDIVNLVSNKTSESINEQVDQEKRRFTPTNSINLSFLFWNGSSFVQSISPLDFTDLSQIFTEGYINSFYLMQVFTSYNEDKNTLINNSHINGFQITTSLDSTYTYSKEYEYSDIHIPISYLDTLTGSTFYLYFKYYYFSAKTGVMHMFYNGNTTLDKEEDMFIKVEFNKNTHTYVTPSTTLKEIINVEYINNINNNIETIIKSKPVPPEGNTFTTDGEYIFTN